MATLYVKPRQVDRIIVTDAPRCRVLALHRHRRARVAKKYRQSMVFQRLVFAPENRDALMAVLRDVWPFLTEKGRHRVCRAMRRHAIDARMERVKR